MKGEARSAGGALAVDAYNEAMLIRELHWTYQELWDAPDDGVWMLSTLFALEGQKQQDDDRTRELEDEANRRLGRR